MRMGGKLPCRFLPPTPRVSIAGSVLGRDVAPGKDTLPCWALSSSALVTAFHSDLALEQGLITMFTFLSSLKL